MSGIEEYSVANAKGITQVLFSSICKHNCFNCHNPESHHYANGYDSTVDELFESVIKNKNKVVTLSGGDPFFQAENFYKLAQMIRQRTHKTIWIYSGFTFEQIVNHTDKYMLKLLQQCDVMVDGKFEESEKDLTLKFRGSSNQRIINIQESLKQNEVVLYQI